MRRSRVQVRWQEGLHLRPAAKLVRLARKYRSTIWLKLGGRVAELRSILGVTSLYAIMGATLEIEASGEDEDLAIRELERVFAEAVPDGSNSDASRLGGRQT